MTILTQAEKEVLDLLTIELLTPKQIQIRRKTSQQAVSKIIKKLKEKGALTTGCEKVVSHEGTLQPSQPNGIRLHAEQWVIKVILKDQRYEQIINKSIQIDNNTVRIHKDSIVIYSNQSFFGSDTWAATAKSVDYWNSFIARLEWEFKCILVKPRAQNIQRVRAEYAQIKNGLAIKANKEAQKIRIRDREDGKIWFEIDNSFNLNEAETKHPIKAERDMQSIVEPFFNDLRDKPLLLPSELYKVLSELALHQKETTATLNILTRLIIPQEKKDQDKPDYFG